METGGELDVLSPGEVGVAERVVADPAERTADSLARLAEAAAAARVPTMASSVDFPEPLAPVTTDTLPALNRALTPRSARTAGG